MPARLSRKDDETLALRLGGLPRPDFQDALQKVHSIAGKRFNSDDPQDKFWEFPAEIETAIKITQMIGPDLSPEISSWIKDASAKIAGELTTKLPDDADLKIPWADRLYAYQRAGIDFLARHPRSILADDMGLGKTVQAISTIRERGIRDYGPHFEPRSLVVCPNPMRRTWANEIEEWAEGTAHILDGKTPAVRKKQLDAVSLGEIAIVNWEKLRIMPELAAVEWYAVVADEAHRAKNRKAQQTKALWKLQAEIQLALTGTPIMNSPDELWSLLRWLYPRDYTSYWRFHNMYVDDYEVFYGNRKTRVVTGVKNADKLRFELADKMVRRTKDEVLDLPPKTWQYIQLDMKPKQAKLYQEIENNLVVEIKQAVKAGTADESALEKFAETGDVKSLAMVIPNGAARVTRLRQVASSPALLGDGEPDESVKYDTVEEIIGDNKGKPFVVFCWFKDAAELIAERLRKKHKLRAQAMTGDTPTSARDDLVARFQTGDLDVLVCTISTGGVGLTLTAADTAIFVERDWTPAINMQAADRLHRIGQENPVTLIVLEASGTVDTGRVGPKNRLKEAIVGQVLGS